MATTENQRDITQLEISPETDRSEPTCSERSKQKIKDLWNHPAGLKTIFFWAPAMKWCLVIAGLSDLQRPAEALSILQTVALAATGLIWSRYSMVIKPKNFSLFTVNVFIAASQSYQLYRAIKHQYFTTTVDI